MSLVKCWADKYLDSGVSLQTDPEPMSASDYDSDDSHNSVETVHHSYSSIPSELEASLQLSLVFTLYVSCVSVSFLGK